VKQAIKAILARLGYRVEGIRYTPRHLLDPSRLRILQFDDVICRYMFENGQDCTFLQIGAYDGISTDPLNKYIERCGWRGVMLEPQPGPASRLRDLYKANDRITIVEAAVDSHRGPRCLYTAEADHLPQWAGGMASLNREHILKHEYLIPGIKTMVRELTVQCIPIADVLDKLPSTALDLLQIDAEGADGYILSLFPFERMKPAIIHWEIKNMTRLRQEEALDVVSSQGYLVARSGDEDMLAVLPAVPRERLVPFAGCQSS
jgi:FkbM family methyltransferase